MNKILIISTILISFNFSAQKMGKLKDKRDGKVYPTVVIGSQTWMAENLNAATFRNGDPIPEAKTPDDWKKACDNKQPVWSYYENRSVQDDAENGQQYGKLYNFYAITDKRGMAPDGWHVSTDDEWTILVNTLGGKDKAGEKLKSQNSWWPGFQNYKGPGNNLSGFNALPGGLMSSCIDSHYFSMVSLMGYFWTSSASSKEHYCLQPSAFSYSLVSGRLDVERKTEGYNMGFSVRCVKD